MAFRSRRRFCQKIEYESRLDYQAMFSHDTKIAFESNRFDHHLFTMPASGGPATQTVLTLKATIYSNGIEIIKV